MNENSKPAPYFPPLKHLNIPNVLTTFGLIFGITAVYFLTHHDFRMAVICLFFASVMDLIDGYFAKKLNQTSDFGKYLDTLVDFFTCCIMPVIIVFQFFSGQPVIVIALIVYVMCGLWRLSYFNIIEAKTHFTGLPVPGSMMIMTMVFYFVIYHSVPVFVAAIFFIAVGLLMISCIKLQKYGLWQKVMGLVGLVFLVFMLFEKFV